MEDHPGISRTPEWTGRGTTQGITRLCNYLSGERSNAMHGPDGTTPFIWVRRHKPDEDQMDYLIRVYRAAFDRFSMLQSPILLVIRVYWGWQFAETGWAKLHHLAKITAFFTTLNIPLPAFSAYFVSGLELVGGILLILGLGSRLTSFLLAGDMLVAY
jgi:hypothetical protein